MAKRRVLTRNVRIRARINRADAQPPAPAAPSVPRERSTQPTVGHSNENATNIWIPIDAYLVRHYGWQTSDKAGCMASIICYNQNTLVGYVNFYNPDYVPLSAINVYTPPQPILTINYPVERVQEVIETLRLEAPVHIGVDLSQRIGWVGIDPAPIGHVAK